MTEVADLSILGGTVRHAITAEQLETFPAPDGCMSVEFNGEELTAMCPMTGQPDTYAFRIQYVPRSKCLESKSLKLYLWSFRDQGKFSEALAAEIAAGIAAAVEAPVYCSLIQKLRGGIETVTNGYHPGPAL